MIKVNKDDGSTLSFDLAIDDNVADLSSLLEDKGVADGITGVGCLFNTYWHQLTKPKKFRNVSYHVEKVQQVKNGVSKDVGEKIVCQADDIQLSILVYYNVRPKMTRIEIKKIGKQRYVPKGLKDGTSKEDSK